ncbi:MAG: galactokinase [Gemmatimonadota bacterium]|nr:galactokinase [Gemmatimonadota bacterium]
MASAPGRVNLIGEHTDYNGGEVLPIAIARRTYVAASITTGESRAVSSNEAARGSFDAVRPERTGEWWDYASGVSQALNARGVAVSAVNIAVASDVPAGAGLSSSAALEVATALALVTLTHQRGSHALGHRDIALLAQRAETEFVGVASGIMDQFASSLGCAGEALHVWCDTGETEQVPMSQTILIFDTAVPRSLRGSAFNQRRAECDEALALLRVADPGLRHLAHATPEQVRAAMLPEPLDRRALHVAEETQRVREMVRVLEATKRLSGELMLASHNSLRDLYECSSPELDWFVDRVMSLPGIEGARLTGAGWGGCAIAAGDALALERAESTLAPEYEKLFGRAPRSWITRASDGARVEEFHA